MAAVVDATTTTVESSKGAAPAACRISFSSGADLALRALLFGVTLAGIVALVTADQTALIPVPQIPGLVLSRAAKFKHSPEIIYLLVALCVTCVYSLLAALTTSLRPISGYSRHTTKTLFLLVVFDVLYAAIMTSAIGAAGGVAWIGLKGNTHTNWNKICNVYGNFCRHIGISIILGIVASIILVLLTILNAHSLYRRSCQLANEAT